eukprot:m.1229007 g.1229007  ORF g.1229007 m.1229007 type:complete len:697 (-) comp24649_c0_seq23:2323-4413(-)
MSKAAPDKEEITQRNDSGQDRAAAAAVAATARSHYDNIVHKNCARVQAPTNFRDAALERRQDRLFPLKDYHNTVKRALITCLSRRCEALLDLACGRGGDLNKWWDAGVRCVDGVDISVAEIDIACRRYADLKRRKGIRDDNYSFVVSERLGTDEIPWERIYNNVSCMFAAHYFFSNRRTVKTFLGNVSSALVEGGYFYGMIPSGKKILQCLAGQDVYKSSILHLRRTWPGDFRGFEKNVFGSGYTFAIVNTVTNTDLQSEELGEGCEEFLVFFSAFTQLAAEHGLFPDSAVPWHQMVDRRTREPLLEPEPAEGKHEAFRMLRPQYPPDNPDAPELSKVSALYAAFVFRKGPPAPPPDHGPEHGTRPDATRRPERGRDPPPPDGNPPSADRGQDPRGHDGGRGPAHNRGYHGNGDQASQCQEALRRGNVDGGRGDRHHGTENRSGHHGRSYDTHDTGDGRYARGYDREDRGNDHGERGNDASPARKRGAHAEQRDGEARAKRRHVDARGAQHAPPPPRSTGAPAVRLEPLRKFHRDAIQRITSNRTVMRWIGNGRGWSHGKIDKLFRFCEDDLRLPPRDRSHFHWVVGTPRATIGYVSIHHVQYDGAYEADHGGAKRYFFTILIDADEQGKGYGAQATRAALVEFHGLRPDVRSIFADIHSSNTASGKLLQKCGFVHVADNVMVVSTRCTRFEYIFT